MATVPLRYANRGGIPMIETIGVSESAAPATVTTFLFNDHPQRRAPFFGGFWVKINVNTATLAQDNNVEFGTQGVTGSGIPLYLYNGTLATVADIATTGGVLLCFYDRVNNRLQLINV